MTETSPSAIKRELAVDQQSPTATRSLSHEQLMALKRLEALQDEGILPENAVTTNMSENDVNTLAQEVHEGSLPTENNVIPEQPDGASGAKQREAPLKVITVDTSVDVRQAAIDFANKRLIHELNQDRGFLRNRVNRIFKGNIAKDYYRAKYAQEAETEMISSANFLGRDATPEQLADARRVLFDRFGLEYEEAIHEEAGESREIVVNEESEFVQRSKELIARYATAGNSAFNRASLDQELNRLLHEFSQGDNPILRGGSLMKVSNLAEIAETVKARVAHGHSIESVMEGMQFINGEARSGVRTDLHNSNVEKLYEKMSKSKNSILRAVTPDALLIAAGIASSVVGFGGRRGVATALTVVPGAAGAVIAGFRENKRTKEDRTQHSREMAQGGRIDHQSKRRQEMEGARYETKRAGALTEALNSLSDGLRDGNGQQATLRDALRGLSDINTRIKLSDTRGIDLISFSSEATVGQERLELDVARAQLRWRIDTMLASMSPEERSAMNIGHGMAANIVQDMSDQFVDVFEGDISEKDKAFRKLKAKRVAIASAKGFAAGLAYGLVSQELFAGFDGDRQGLIEQAWGSRVSQPSGDGTIHQTLLESWVHGDKAVVLPSQYGGNDILHQLSPDVKVTAPDSISFRMDGNDSFSILDKNGNEILTGLDLLPNGQIDASSIHEIENLGFGVTENSSSITIPGQDIEQTITYGNPGDYVQQHGGVEISGRSWADNDTEVFDKNELRLWSMETGNDGTVNASIHTMTEDGSYGQGDPVNWRATQSDGNLVALITGSRGTQNYAFEVPIDANGGFSIPPDSPAYKFFDVTPGENWNVGDNFKGAFIEVAQKTPDMDGGASLHAHMLATYSGSDSVPEITEVIKVPGEPVVKSIYEYDLNPIDTEVPVHTEMAPSIPVVGRRSMERLGRGERVVPYGPSGSSYENSPEVWAGMERDRSPRLRNHPSAELNLGQELGWHDQLIRRNGGEAYVRDIESAIDNTKELLDIGSKTKAIVTIPVGAALESDNIYRSLSLYGKQRSQESIDATTILLHVNWIDQDLSDPKKAAKIRKTKAEIARARADYPNLKIAVIESEWSREGLDKGEYGDRLIGHVSQKMYDVAMKSVKRAIDEGRVSPDKDVLIIKNDADNTGMDGSYLEKMIKSFETHPENDVFTGAIRWGVDRWRDLPGLGVVTQFVETARIVAQLKSVQGFQTSMGPNAAVRMSTFAAVGGIGHYGNQKGTAPDDLAIGERVWAARNAMSSSGAGGRQYTPITSMGSGTNDYHRHVVGADIDTLADRQEAIYIKGLPITATWDKATNGNTGEMRGRRDELRKGEREDLEKSPEKVVARIEHNISSVITHWVTDPKQVATTLGLLFPDPRSYSIKRGAEGADFRLTPSGRRWMIKQLRRNSRNERDYYGDKAMRRLYNDVPGSARSRRRLTRATPKMVGGVLKYSTS